MSRDGARDQRSGGRGAIEGRRLRRRRARPTVMALEDRRLMSTFTVTNTADGVAGSLRYELELANSNAGANTIDFDSTVFNTALTITLAGSQLELSNTTGSETITGPAAGLTVSGGGLSRVFQVDANVTASISGLTITGGSASGPGAGLANDGTTTLTNCTISGNSALSGGGLYTDEYGTTMLTDCTVSGNSASGNGGGLYDLIGTTALTDCTVSGNSAGEYGGGLNNLIGTTTLTNCTISGNSAVNGGGLSTFFGTNTLTNCTFSRNLASENGGGVYNNGGTNTLTNCTFSGDSASENGGGLDNLSGTTTLYSCTFSGDSASENGGGLDNNGSGTTLLTNCTFSGDSASENGGGLDDRNSTTALTNCTFSGDSASENGGGLYNLNGTATLTNVVVSGNSAVNGGGLDNYDGTTALTDCTVSGNSATSGGGAFNDLGTTTLLDCSVSGNSATSGGGVGTDQYGTTTLTNCTVSGNSATSGGGLYTGDDGTTALTDCTVSGNSAVNGGGLSNSDGTVTIGNTIVAENTTTSSGPDAFGTFASLGNNLIGETDGGSGWAGSDLTGTSAQPLNPLLAPLGSYAGLTQTMAVLPGSPAIDAGNNALIPTGVTTDQRGLPRIVNDVVDIGAFESSGFTIAPTSGSGQSTGVLTAFSAPLVATVTANNPSEPVAGGLVPFTPPQSGASATLSGSPATISATGTVSVTATANDIVGSYTVSAGARGITNTASFSLINQAIPTITTTPSMTTVTLGTSSVNLKDTAVLSDGYYETGTLTFTLYLGNTLVDTEMVSVNGNSAYTTPAGYMLPTTGTVTGTYQWDASYSGDTYNTSASENNVAAEQVVVSPAIPSIATTPSPATVTLGASSVTLNDTAELSGGYNDTGAITFTLFLGNSLLDTETVSVSSNGSYTTPIGYTLPTMGTVTGTYQWDASYSGDNNNTTASDNNASDEQVVVSSASPSITTTPNLTMVTLSTSSVTLNDTAVLSGGYSPTGTITFTLYQGGTLLNTQTVSVNGNGSYTTPTGYTLPTAETVTGTYQWDASYSGDTNNTTASDNNASGEQVTVNPAIPTITTTPSTTTVTLGTSSVNLQDTAVLSGGYYETGTITFTLYLGNTLVDTEAVSVGGNGSYTTPAGHTLPMTGTVTGTYQWDASYRGDINNHAVNDNDASNEREVVSPASPSITTTPGGTLPVGGITISGTKYLDLTGNGFSSDDTPQAGVTIDLYQATNGGGETFVASTSTGPNGSYSFMVSMPGTYDLQESVPSGYIQTGGGPSGSAGNSYYTIVAAAGHSYSGYNFDDYQIPTCTPTNVCYRVTTPSGCSQTVTNLAGNTQQGDTVTVTFTVPSGMNDQLTLVSYIAPGSSFSDSTAYEQVIYRQATGTFAPGTHSLTVQIPNSYYQIDFVCGPPITQFEPNQNNDAYGPDSANILYHSEDRFISSDNGGTTAPKPMPAPSPSPTTPAPSSSAMTLTDSATLSGGYNPGGTITFYLFTPGTTPNGTDSNNIYADTVTVNGNGTYITATGSNPGGYIPTVAGTYEWVAVYGGDGNNNGVTRGYDSEPETVSKANPAMNTTPGGPVTCGGIVKLTDTAVLSGGYNPGGTITFYLFAPGTTPNGSDSNNVYADTVTVNGNGTYTTSLGNNAGGYAATRTGTYEWVAVYGGDGNNNGVSDTFGSEPETVNASCSVGSGQYATCGFWQGRNGQAIICSFDNGPNDTQLGNWLASNFPSLFGGSNPYISSYLNQCHTTSLAGLTNSQIATLCSRLSTSGAAQNAYAQAFACALGIYADSSPFGGNATCQGYGFSVTWAGGSGGTYNVGSNNTPFGVSRNTSLSVCSILQNLNGNFSPSSGNFYGGNQSSTTAAINVLNGINTAGQISNGLTLAAPSGTVAYTPAQIRDAYGINDLSEDGTGQTIAIVDAYNDPDIFQAVDLFDSQFGLTDSGPTIYDRYGPAASFLTVLNQGGQTTSLPSTDPSGVGADNWEVEEELDVEWAHAIAPGAQIVLVEADSQSLSDLMASVATAAAQPGVSVVTMSWGFPEGQSVFAADEANYDSVFNVSGVTFLASTGDYGVSDLQYPAFSPNVVAVGGTSLNLNADNSYNSETAWGYYSDSMGISIGSGGGLSLYEPEPSYQEGIQSTGSRTTPDVSMVADPATGAWVADPYNLSTDNPFEIVGGTSLSAPAFSGLAALIDQGRAAAGEAALNSTSPTETQQALYSLPQADYNSITSGSNGYTANAGYNLVTGLGTPIANLLVPDLIDYQGPGTSYAGPTVGPLQDATLDGNWISGGGGGSNAFNVFNAVTLGSDGFGQAQATATGMPIGGMPATVVAGPAAATAPAIAVASPFGPATGHVSPNGPVPVFGWQTNSSPASAASQPMAEATIAPVWDGHVAPMIAWSTAQPGTGTPIAYEPPSGFPTTACQAPDVLVPARSRMGLVPDSVLDDLAVDPALWQAQQRNGTITIPAFPTDRVTRDPVIGDPLRRRDRPLPPADYAAGLAVLGLAAGFLANGTGLRDARKRQLGRLFSRRKPI